MKNILNKSLLIFLGMSMFLSMGKTQQTTDQALEACMNKTMAQSAAVGAVVGGLLGALFGGGDKNKSALQGAALGGAAGGVIGWQSSWKSCTESVNVVTFNNVQTEDYKKTAERLAYTGQGVLFKVEGLDVSEQVIAGNQLSTSLKFVVLKPEPAETVQIKITRSWVCGGSQITIKPEIFTVAQGSIFQDGKVQIPSSKPNLGLQECVMDIQITAEGQSYQVKRPFTIQPS